MMSTETLNGIINLSNARLKKVLGSHFRPVGTKIWDLQELKENIEKLSKNGGCTI